MKTFSRLLAPLVVLLLLVPQLPAQNMEQGRRAITLAADYDLDAVAYTAMWTTGAKGRILEDGVPIDRKVKNGAGTTDITCLIGVANGCLTFAGVNDVLVFATPTIKEVVVTTATDAQNVVVSPLIDLSAFATTGITYYLRDFATGTANDDGAIPMAGFQDAAFHVQVSQANTTTGIDFRVECRGIAVNPIWNPVDVYTFAAPGTGSRTTILDPARYDACRVVAKMNTTDDGGDAGANAEKVGIRFVGYMGEK